MLLIGASLTFLFIFLLIWNLDNYNSEKDKLRRDLAKEKLAEATASHIEVTLSSN